jgi:outer membrane protein assembly factor BamB
MNYRTKLITLVLLILGLSMTINADPSAAWKFTTGGPVYASPAYYNGNIYIGSDDGNLYCLDALTGSKQWEFKTGGLIRCRPAISAGNVYFASDDGYLYSLNASSGVQNWSYNIGNHIKRILPDLNTSTGNLWDYFQSSPCIDSGTVYIGSADSCLYAIDTLGNYKWKVATKGLVRSSPCVYQNNVYVGSWDGFIYSISKSNGSVIWKFNLQGPVMPSPYIADTILYCGSRGYVFDAINAVTGKLIWKYNYINPYVESSATFGNGFVYVGSSDDNNVYSFNAQTGVLNWTCHASGTTWSSPIYDNGTLFIGMASYSKYSMVQEQGGAILALNATNGKINWKLNCGKTPFIGGVVSSPAVINNVVYYGSLDSNVYAVVNNTTGIENKQGSSSMPKEYQLINYPNPFNPTTNISYTIPVNENISLKVYNILGQQVATIFQGFQKAGTYIVNFDASKLTSGVYLCGLQAANYSEVMKMMLMK